MRSAHWLLVAPLLAAAHARPLFSLRGGQAADAGTQTPPEIGNPLEAYVDSLADFMQTFENLNQRASSTCKGSAFLGFKASAARVKQRADRRALQSAHRQIREIYHDAIGHACQERS